MIILAFIGSLCFMELCTDQLLRAQLVPFETKRVSKCCFSSIAVCVGTTGLRFFLNKCVVHLTEKNNNNKKIKHEELPKSKRHMNWVVKQEVMNTSPSLKPRDTGNP